MDFSCVPFRGAVERFAHLLPISAFVRLSSVHPIVATQKYTRVVERARVYLEQERVRIDSFLGKAESATYYAPGEVLHDGPLKCHYLTLSLDVIVDPEALQFESFQVDRVGPTTLSHLTQKLSEFCVLGEPRDFPRVALDDVFSRLGAALRRFDFPVHAFLDGTAFGPPTLAFAQRQESSLFAFCNVTVSCFDELWTCLEDLPASLVAPKFPKYLNVVVRYMDGQPPPTAEDDARISDLLGPHFQETDTLMYDGKQHVSIYCVWKQWQFLRRPSYSVQ